MTSASLAPVLHAATRATCLRPLPTESAVSAFIARLVSPLLDLLIYTLSAPVTLTVSAIVLRGLWPVGACAGVLVYFAASYASGRSPAMRLLGLRVCDARTGHLPTSGQAFGRAILTVAPLAAIAVLLSGVEPLRFSPTLAPATLSLLLIVAIPLGAAAGHLWTVVDPGRRSLLDHCTGVVVVRGTSASRPRRSEGWVSPRP